MKNMARFKSVIACVCMVFLVALAIVPMFTVSASAATGNWTLVTDASTLEAGDQIVIVAKEFDYALSTNQKSNNRGAVAVTKDTTNNTVKITDNTQIIKLEKGTSDDTFAFNVGDSYLYAASSSNNQLKTKTTLDVNGSWKIEVTNGVASITAPESSNRNVMQYNPNNGDPLFACYAKASQKALSVYKFVEDDENTPSCEHTNTEITGYKEATCTAEGYTGDKVCNDCDETVKGEVIPALGHKYEGEKCTRCGEAKPQSLAGRYYIATIRSSGNYFYMTSDVETASTKRYAAVDSGLQTLPTKIEATKAGYVFVLEENDDGTYCIYADGAEGDNYLGWTSGNSGTLVAKEDAVEATVGVNEDGFYNIHFTADEERYLSLNATTGNNYFAWYKGTQKQDLILIPVGEEEPECNHEFNDYGYCTVCQVKIESASVAIGSNLSMIYNVNLMDESLIGEGQTLAMQFAKNDKTYYVTADAVDGKYSFAFRGIAPQEMCDTLDAYLVVLDSNGEVVKTLDSKTGYSVKENLVYLLETYSTNEALVQLVNDMLIYGEAAQNYTNYATDKPATDTDGVEVTPSDAEPETTYKAITTADGVTVSDTYFTAAGVFFDDVNKIYVKFVGTSSAKLVIKNGTNVIATYTEFETADGGYICYTDGISAKDFATVYTFELSSGDTLIQTVTYSVNSYAYSMVNSATATDEMKELALALYRYGVSAEAYVPTEE